MEIWQTRNLVETEIQKTRNLMNRDLINRHSMNFHSTEISRSPYWQGFNYWEFFYWQIRLDLFYNSGCPLVLKDKQKFKTQINLTFCKQQKTLDSWIHVSIIFVMCLLDYILVAWLENSNNLKPNRKSGKQNRLMEMIWKIYSENSNFILSCLGCLEFNQN